MRIIEITIPVLNEQNTIVEKIDEICLFVNNHLNEIGDIRVIIADNGSTDNTEILGRELSQKYARVRYLRIGEKGVGRALKKSWSNSKAEIIGYMDLDLSTDLNALPIALKSIAFDNFDVVAGSRLKKGSVVIGRSIVRGITSRAFNFLIKFVFRTNFSDGMCGFKFLKSDCFFKLYNNGANNDGWFFATELLVVAEKIGLNILDLPVKWTDDPDSKVKILALTKQYIKDIIALNRKLE